MDEKDSTFAAPNDGGGGQFLITTFPLCSTPKSVCVSVQSWCAFCHVPLLIQTNGFLVPVKEKSVIRDQSLSTIVMESELELAKMQEKICTKLPCNSETQNFSPTAMPWRVWPVASVPSLSAATLRYNFNGNIWLSLGGRWKTSQTISITTISHAPVVVHTLWRNLWLKDKMSVTTIITHCRLRVSWPVFVAVLRDAMCDMLLEWSYFSAFSAFVTAFSYFTRYLFVLPLVKPSSATVENNLAYRTYLLS